VRTFLLAAILLSATSHAQVLDVECPRSFPPEDSALAAVPAGHRGKGLVETRELVNVGIFGGEFGGKEEFVSGLEKKVKGGTDMIDFSPPTWLVCYYRGGVNWWEKVDAGELMAKGKLKQGCVIQTREKGKSIRLLCR
jgi:hypothetical protein